MRIAYALSVLALAACGGGSEPLDSTAFAPDGKMQIARCYNDCDSPFPEPTTKPAVRFLGSVHRGKVYFFDDNRPEGGWGASSLMWAGGEVYYQVGDGDLQQQTGSYLGRGYDGETGPHELKAYRDPSDNSIIWYDENNNLVSQQWHDGADSAPNGYPIEHFTIYTPATGYTVVDLQDNVLYIWKPDGNVEAIDLTVAQVNELNKQFDTGPGWMPDWIMQFRFGVNPQGIPPASRTNHSPTAPPRSQSLSCSNCPSGYGY